MCCMIMTMIMMMMGTVSAFGVLLPNTMGTSRTSRSHPFLSSSGHRNRIIVHERGQVETIEYKIYPDGRVEEVVRGIKGGECHKVTEEIHKALGKVVSSEPTEEMYENELVVDQTVTQRIVGDGSNGASSSSSSSSSSSTTSWDGSSTW